MSGFKPFAWEGIKVHSSGLRYNVRLEDYVLRGESGGEEAVMFTWSYTMEKGDPSRPVIFAYNGGPGSPSAWLHMGLLGPKLVEIPGYPSFSEGWRIRDNEEFLLDQCDLVLVDPAGTGWAGLLDQKAAGEYYSVAGDGRAFARLIALPELIDVDDSDFGVGRMVLLVDGVLSLLFFLELLFLEHLVRIANLDDKDRKRSDA